jgi:uncharacterized protein
MSWRQRFRALHRDLGYAAAALTIAYALSGLAVNHIEDWNPNYVFRESAIAIGAVPRGTYAEMQAYVVEALKLPAGEVRGHVMDTETLFRVFLVEGQEVRVDVRTGQGTIKRVHTRPVLFEVNALHLNNLKGVWTWVADVFALSLMTLAITGLLLHKGKLGLAGRGKWFVGAGLLVPAAFVVYLYW